MIAKISDIWSKLTIYPKFQLRLYGHFGFMVNFSKTKPWTLYPKPGVYNIFSYAIHILDDLDDLQVIGNKKQSLLTHNMVYKGHLFMVL